ncbi:hypothetical protein [Sinorhizobium terangae]|uniref:hypothetical protein n=1 Tax=Sinorhizobium terangae TaxID=110322 RepID=UPI0024B042CB|nr:hypothetical protein [Sinorhizobium terangae]WFU47728.1 hypothetical protein QA637_18070 [Sinorhizobium terangae]
MEYELITEQDYDALPEEPALKFVALEAICRRNMNQFISEQTPATFDRMIEMQYMSVVSAAAEELGIGGLSYPSHLDEPYTAFNDFLLEAAAAVTRIRLRNSSSKAGSVRLSQRSRAKIELQLRRLEQLIEEAEMSEGRRKALLQRIDQFRHELDQTRLSFGKAMALLAAVSLGITSGTSFLADAPEAIATITSLIGADKEAEDQEAKRLGATPVPKALPAPDAQRANEGDRSNYELTDDDIPF